MLDGSDAPRHRGVTSARETMIHAIDATRTEGARLEELDRYAVLSDPPTEALRNLVELVAHVCAVPRAAINVISRDQQHSIATIGFDESVCAREDSLCGLVLTEPEPVVVSDASADERFSGSDFVNGSLASVRFYASAPLVTPDGAVLGRLCVFDDEPRTLEPRERQALRTVADQVMDVLELRQRGRELRRSNEHLSQFAGQISHDLRSPLTAILTNAEMLAHEPAIETDDDLGSMVEAVSSAGHRMNRMIEEMLGLALKGGGLTVEPTSVQDVVDLALTDLAPSLTQSGATVTTSDLPTADADPAMLYSIVLNLLTNALKFTRDGVAPVIHVWAEDRGDCWRVTIDDNGPGIAPERRERVFQPYERGDTQVPGHGIGLATTRRLVQAHGGRVGLDVSPAGGTSVWFELPA